MNMKSILRLPWRLKEVVRAVRRDVETGQRASEEVLRIVLELERRQAEIERDRARERDQGSALEQELLRQLVEARGHTQHLEAEIGSLRELIHADRDLLLGEIREHGLLTETAARCSSRSDSEARLREQLVAPSRRQDGVSVLVTCWNHVGYLERAVTTATAALDLLPVPGEVLILDDGSRDGSRELQWKLARADERVRLIQSERNLGLPRARNVLLSQARFEHAMILDSDNQLVPSGLGSLYLSALQTGAVLAYGCLINIQRDGSVIGVISNERLTSAILRENWIDAMVMVRTGRLLELGGYDTQWLHGLEDWELNQRLFTLGEPMAFVPVVVGKYTTAPLSMFREAPTYARYRRGLRVFCSVDGEDSSTYRACVHHPALGTLWSSQGWSGTEPDQVRVTRNRTRERLKILVVSSGGVLNLGDDAILLSTLQRLQRVRPGSLASVVSDGERCPPLGRLAAWAGTCDEFVGRLHGEDVLRGLREDRSLLEELSRWVKFGTSRSWSLESYDLVVMAGGGNLNLHWPDLIARRAAIAAAANAAGVPYILSGQGIGPISDEIIPMLSFLAGGAKAVATRDPESAELLRKLCPNGPPMDMVGDDALGLRNEGLLASRRRLAEIGVPPGRRLLAFHAREACYMGFSRAELHETARTVDQFAAENGYAVVCVPINMQPHDPEVALLLELATGGSRRADWFVVNPGADIAAVAGVFKACDAILAHSYHAAIFALENRIPTLLFAGSEYYRLKADALRRGFGIPVPIIADPGLTSHSIADRVREISRASWSRGMTGADVDAWYDRLLPPEDLVRLQRSPTALAHESLGLAG